MKTNPNFAASKQPREDLSADYVRSLLDYDPMTGVFVWRRRVDNPAFNTQWAGKVAGKVTKSRYHRIKIDYLYYQAHRLAWLWVHGSWPIKQIDHRNQNRSDNRLANLREADRFENQRNRSKASHNTSGYKGVSWDASRNKWIATIGVNGRLKNLGRFDRAEDAHLAYRDAAKLMHGSFARLD